MTQADSEQFLIFEDSFRATTWLGKSGKTKKKDKSEEKKGFL